MGAFINLCYHSQGTRESETPVEFDTFGQDVLDSEELTNVVCRSFCALMAKNYVSNPWGCYEGFDVDLGRLVVHGLYVPCVKRVAYTCQVDQRNDGLPWHAAVLFPNHKSEIEIHQLRRVDRFPIGMAAVSPGTRFRHVVWSREEFVNRREKRHYLSEKDVLVAYDAYLTVTPDDRVVHGLATRVKWQRHPLWNAVTTVWPSIVFNAWGDRHCLWQVRTTEEVAAGVPTPLTLGVSPEHVKSLFYARNLPVTETGRKRPILHWVKAHARRMAEGTDVDVRKHLRGITEFDMDGMHFQIVSPEKKPETGGPQ